jgi:hypothetical protein
MLVLKYRTYYRVVVEAEAESNTTGEKLCRDGKSRVTACGSMVLTWGFTSLAEYSVVGIELDWGFVSRLLRAQGNFRRSRIFDIHSS